MNKSPQNEYILNQSSEGLEPKGQLSRGQGILTGPRILIIAAALFALLLVYAVYQLHQTDATLAKQLEQANKRLALIAQRLDDSDSRIAQLTAQFRVSTERLGLTQTELDRTRQIAARIREEQQQRVQDLSQQLEKKAEAEQLAALQKQTASSLGALSGDVSATRQEVASVNKDVVSTREEVSSIKLKLSEYGTLIAQNRDELAVLRRKGERDYFEFDLRKGNYQQVADLRLKIDGVDVKKQRLNIEYVADDRKLKRDKVNINEPVQVFVGGLKTPYEIVVNHVQKDRAIGYVSAPKDRGSAPGSPIK
jgi:chromosome segregation ATPase